MSQTNARFILFNEFDSAENLSADSVTLANLEVTNLQFYGNSQRFRAAEIAQTVITGTWPTARHISSFVPYGHNMIAADDTVQIELFSDVAMTISLLNIVQKAVPTKAYNDLEYGIDAYNKTTFSDWPSAYSTFWFTQTAARAFRITLKSPNNLNGFIDIKRIYMGRHLSPKVNFDWGQSISYQSLTDKKRTAGGSLFGRKKSPSRILKIQLSWLENTDISLFLEAMRRVGTHEDIFVSLYPELGGEQERNNSMAGKLADSPEFTHPFFNNYKANFVIEEA